MKLPNINIETSVESVLQQVNQETSSNQKEEMNKKKLDSLSGEETEETNLEYLLLTKNEYLELQEVRKIVNYLIEEENQFKNDFIENLQELREIVNYLIEEENKLKNVLIEDRNDWIEIAKKRQEIRKLLAKIDNDLITLNMITLNKKCQVIDNYLMNLEDKFQEMK